MENNGWFSVYDNIRPESGEEVLTLAYVGDIPAPEDMFAPPEDRAYCVCTYYYPGDLASNEVVGEVEIEKCKTAEDFFSIIFEDITIREEGFYSQDPIGPRGANVWHRLAEIKEGNYRGIVCWKHLDYPSI